MTRCTRWLAASALSALALLGAACGGSNGGGDAEVAVTLREFSITVNPAETGAGLVTFQVTNEGPDRTHEFLVLRTDLAPESLPTNEDGSADIGGDGVAFVGQIQEMEVGQTLPGSYDLEAGSYVLICNLFEQGEGLSHYQQGMNAAFSVS